MKENEKRLGQALVGLYKLVRLQQEAISTLMLRSQAIADSLVSTSPSLAAEIDKNMQKAMGNPTDQALAAALAMIDSTIASLRHDFDPWEN